MASFSLGTYADGAVWERMTSGWQFSAVMPTMTVPAIQTTARAIFHARQMHDYAESDRLKQTLLNEGCMVEIDCGTIRVKW